MKIFLLFIALFLGGCLPMTAERKARLAKTGMRDIMIANQFAEVYPNALHRIIWAGGDWELIARAGIHQRYEVSMTVPVNLGIFGGVRQKGPVSFHIVEVSSVTLSSRFPTKSYTSNQRRLSDADWEKLRAAKGDLRAIGYPVTTTNPVKDFDEGLRMF